jgi:hypothetical protein
VSPGGEPERDDSGLPPVDIQIPDDARELDRDVQAYYREERALRRHQRQTRWHRSLGRDGIMLPLLACCLILALITGTLLTVFTATSGQNLGLSGTGSSPSAPASHGSASSGVGSGGTSASPGPHFVRKVLPAGAMITTRYGLVPVAELSSVMLVLVPQRCGAGCGRTLTWLADAAGSAGVEAFLVYNQQTEAEVAHLYSRLDARRQAELAPTDDVDDVLTSSASYPRGIPATQLTAILMSANRTVRYAGRLSPAESPTSLLNAIIH